MQKLLLLHGPNLNFLGMREPDIYGIVTLADINQMLQAKAQELGYQLQAYQSNIEGELVTLVQQAKSEQIQGIIINAGAYTHTSVALRDALLAVEIPFVEVHLSNLFKRETFRQFSLLSDIAIGQIAGFGAYSYELALLALQHYLSVHEQRSESIPSI